MTTTWKRSALRWLPTFAGFPLGGVAAELVAGPIDGVVAALLGGAITGLMETQYAVFGSSGALVITAATAVLPVLLAGRAPRSAS